MGIFKPTLIKLLFSILSSFILCWYFYYHVLGGQLIPSTAVFLPSPNPCPDNGQFGGLCSITVLSPTPEVIFINIAFVVLNLITVYLWVSLLAALTHRQLNQKKV